MSMATTMAPQHLLVFNSGSATLKASVFRLTTHVPQQVATRSIELQGDSGQADADAYANAALRLLDEFAEYLHEPWMTAHRVVHGGDSFESAVLVDDATLAAIDGLSVLAPLHQPAAVAVMRALRQHDNQAPMVVVFDTLLFRNLPDVARCYALPAEVEHDFAIQRFGFHGIAHSNLRDQYRAGDGHGRRLITLQLGGGCSATAFLDDLPLDTSMGYTPAEGLMMGTRCGNVDASIVLRLLRAGWNADAIEDLLNRRSGLLGVSGVSEDMRLLQVAAADGHARAQLAIDLFCYRLRLQIAAYAATLGGLDALVFGGGLGHNAPRIRRQVCAGLDWLGIVLDPKANADPSATAGRMATTASRVDVCTYETDEATPIAHAAVQVLTSAQGGNPSRRTVSR